MAKVRLCLLLLVTIASHRLAAGSPFGFLCSLLCDDDDSSSDDSYDDILDGLFDPCFACPSDSSGSSSPSEAANESASAPGKTPAPINLMIPPANGLNVSLENIGGSWWLNLFPWAGGSPGQAATPAPVSATPAATTPGNDTATTAAPTTAKA
ncbi:uncharacterized protein LOC131851951 [Achroia grisella]|uniref:uncharacterized protein LOC131851951 n=1 Tax=Achroia grisella TaxID=688607 RepID=UPI0027D34B5F|nr:uncharacterized protein LOC131851951 [Achroia grisella]